MAQVITHPALNRPLPPLTPLAVQMYIQQMTERHAQKLREFQEELHTELTKKPPKYSKELLDWRRREQLLAKCADVFRSVVWSAVMSPNTQGQKVRGG